MEPAVRVHTRKYQSDPHADGPLGPAEECGSSCVSIDFRQRGGLLEADGWMTPVHWYGASPSGAYQ
jgi:hypothetical protein